MDGERNLAVGKAERRSLGIHPGGRYPERQRALRDSRLTEARGYAATRAAPTPAS
jgi:hypothetical protein